MVRKQPLTQRRERDGNAHHHVLLLVLEQVHDLVHMIWEHAIGHPLERRDGGANHAFRIVLESLADGKHLVFVQARLVEDAHRAQRPHANVLVLVVHRRHDDVHLVRRALPRPHVLDRDERVIDDRGVIVIDQLEDSILRLLRLRSSAFRPIREERDVE